jgi:hypothetical protein
MQYYAKPAIICTVGDIDLSPSRRLRATLRNEKSAGMMLDVVLQIQADGRWAHAQHALRIEADRLPELIELPESAITKLPRV